VEKNIEGEMVILNRFDEFPRRERVNKPLLIMIHSFSPSDEDI
jgi:hypothetical protein